MNCVIHPLLQQIETLQDRLDTAITFTLVNYFHQTLERNFDVMGVYYLCFLAFIVASGFKHVDGNRDTALSRVCDMTRNFSIMLFVQHASRSTSSDFTATSSMHISAMSIHTAAGYSILILVAIIPKYIINLSFTQRSISLVLYILTDSTSAILNSMKLGINGVFLSLLAIITIKLFSSRLSHPVLYYILRLVDMIIVNILITSISSIDTHNTRVDVKAALMIFFLFVVDTIRTYDNLFENARNYAVWKISQQIFLIYHAFGVDDVILMYISIIIVLVESTLTTTSSTLTEVSLLLAVNQILNSIQDQIMSESNSSQYTLLLFYIILIHTTQSVFFAVRQ